MSPVSPGITSSIPSVPSTGQFALITRPRFRRFFGVVHQFLPLASGARNLQDTQTIDGQADYWIYKRAATANSFEAKVQFIVGTGRLFMDVPHFMGLDGIGQFPFLLPPQGQIVPKANTFSMIASDRQIVQSAQNIRVLHIGEKVFGNPIEPPKAYTRVMAYQYTANFTADDNGNGPIAANSILDFGVRISGDADFDIYGFAVLADSPLLTLQIEVSGRNEEWFSRPVHGMLVGATAINAPIPAGGTPFRLPHPLRVRATGTINTRVADLSGASNRVQVVYFGLWCEPGGGIPFQVPPSARQVVEG